MTTAGRVTRWMLALAAIAAGCGDGPASLVCDGGGCGTQSSWRRAHQFAVNRKVDILFVIDNTAAIAPYASVLAAGYADMAQALQTLPLSGPASLHVGFVRAESCDTGTRAAACGLAAPDQYLRSEWCEMTTNFPGELDGTFGCLADLGAADCTPAQPLAVALRMLTGPPAAGWEGFVRPDAYLLIVVVAAADDASGTPDSPTSVSAVATAVKALKPDPAQTLVSTIVPQKCLAGGNPAPRLTEFVNQFGGNGLIVDLCDGQLARALDRVTSTISTSTEPWCVGNVRDTDPGTPGLQADCAFEDFPRAADGSWTAVRLPRCDQSAPPCWRLLTSDVCRNGYTIDIDRGGGWCDEAGTLITVECLGCADANDPACAFQP
jgi:hypothetical protein